MSIAILSIPIGIIAIFLFIWSINKMGEKPAKGKKKDDDSALIGIIVSVVLFFVSLGIFDGSESTAGLFTESNSAQEQAAHHGDQSSSTKSEAQREVEEYNKAAVEKARSGESNDSSKSQNDKNSSNTENAEQSSSTTNLKEASETSVVNKAGQNKNLEKQQQAYQKWNTQLEAQLQVIDTTWSALWTDGSAESIEKLIKALDNSKVQLKELKVPEELSAAHKQKLTETLSRYVQWIDSYHKACQMKSSGSNQHDIIAEVARGDGLKLRSNVEVSSVGRELGISE